MNKLKMISDMTVNCLTSFRRPLRRKGLLTERPILSVVFAYLANTVLTSKTQDKSYYKNLTPITVTEICKTFRADEEMLFEKYGVKHMYVFGSCAKGEQRIDSDIDLLVNFSLDLTLEEREKNAKSMFDYYTNLFRRFVDINEVGEYIPDRLIKETIKHKKIF